MREISYLSQSLTGRALLAELEYDWPQDLLGWGLYGGGFLLAMLFVFRLYLKDTVGMSAVWKVWLTTLRLAVFAVLIWVALNPHDRSTKVTFRPSRVAILIDTSLSMGEDEKSPPPGTATGDAFRKRSRAEAVAEVFQRSKILETLRERHEVSLYTFDSKPVGPIRTFRSNRSGPSDTEGGGATNPDGTARTAGPSDKGNSNLAGGEKPRDGVPPVDDTPLDWMETLKPVGAETRMGDSLRTVINDIRGRTLSGIVIVSDGNSNAGVEPLSVRNLAKTSNVRLVTVGVGSLEAPVNLKLAELRTPTDVSRGDPFEIHALVQGTGLGGREIEVQLLSRPADVKGAVAKPVPDTLRRIVLSADPKDAGAPVKVTYQVRPTDVGRIEYTVATTTAQKLVESKMSDNSAQRTINVTERNLGVLIIAGGPLRDYHFVRNLLYRHNGMNTDVWLQTIDSSNIGNASQESDDLLISFPESFPTRPLAAKGQIDKKSTQAVQYDVVIAFDPNWRSTGFGTDGIKKLTEWVATQSGGIVLVAKETYTQDLASAGPELEPIRNLYPVVLERNILGVQGDSSPTSPYRIAFTPDAAGAALLTLDENSASGVAIPDQWKDFPGIFRCYPTRGKKAGATVYANFSDPGLIGDYGAPILFASQFYGSGRVFYSGSEEIWRMRSVFDDSVYDRFWINAVRFAGQGRLNRSGAHGTILLERDEFILGQTVRVRAQLFDSQNRPLTAESVPMEVFDPNGTRLETPVPLLKDTGNPGYFLGSFRANLAGKYQVELSNPGTEPREVLRKDLLVNLPNIEFDRIEQDARLLDDLTRDTGGKYLRLDEVETKLAALLPDRAEELPQEDRPRSLWDFEWVMFVLIGLLSIEWMTRKMLKLA